MPVGIRDHISISEKLSQLKVRFPHGLAILPGNIAEASEIQELRQDVESETVRALWRTNNIEFEEIFQEDEQPPYLQQYGSEWFGPTFFVTAGLLAQDPNILAVTLGLITNYLYDLFKGDKKGTASLKVIYQKTDGTCKEIRYNGPVEGLVHVPNVLREIEAADTDV